MKYPRKIIFLLVIPFLFALSQTQNFKDKDVESIYFKTNEYYISDAYKDKIRNLLLVNKQYFPLKILILGHTDNVGSREYNYKLGEERAKSVKLEIMGSFSIAPENITTMSRGEDSPMASNLTAEGRARNRRVDIGITERSESVSSLDDILTSHDPNKKQIDRLLEEADTELDNDNYEGTLAKLKQVKELGGDKYSDWHLLMGYVALSIGQGHDEARFRFQRALDLESTNYRAKRGLAIIRVREQIINGEVTRKSGRSENDPIKIDYVAQEKILMTGYFNVEPVQRRTDYTKNLDIWNCKTTEGENVTYYFDFTNVYQKE